MKDIRLSLVQMGSVVGDTDGNLQRMIQKINELSGSDIICFPEACLTGYTSDDPGPHSISSDDERIKILCKNAKISDITIIFGFIERDGEDLFITHAVADGTGKIGFYRKTHLGRGERSAFRPGDVISAFDSPLSRIGIQLCWESHFPDITCKLRKEGAEIVLISYASPLGGDRRRDIWMRHLPARAADNCVFVGAVNGVGDNGKGVRLGGGCIAIDPKGKVIGEYFGDDEHVLTVDLLSKHKDALGTDDNMGSIDYFMYRRDDLY